MEVLTIVLSGLLSLASSGGIIADSVAASRIRSQIISLEEQKIRIDNSPNYAVAGGKLQKVRIATRGSKIKPDLRIEALELETDRVDLNLKRLNLDSIDELRRSLNRPFQGAVRLVLTEVDLNRALKSPLILDRIQKILNRLIISKAGSTNIAYKLLDLKLELRPQNRLGVKFKLSRSRSAFETDRHSGTSRSRELVMELELGVRVVNGKTIALIEPQGTVNGRPMSPRLLNGFAIGISDRLDLGSLSRDGILARILQLEIDEDKVELASFFKLETKNP
ncbi:DUF2993 domain-containing protein [Waterburya agarophytonicola K14]|uniref:DUF2993 domain-containing protein n=1 Tax=Waterburya agarophytonicola KI4 TaxID=2874699 RepID=A0A964BSZ5_9CYAN|nr:DUF2993 domain-containing protein [Waterburya agarophytonicola]MCC0177617.1 DUF2993 domain-containing protein [Waterburya agarophytonicola KI4]